MKQKYKIFIGNNYIKNQSSFWKECEEKRIVNLYAVKKRLYASVEWDYYTLTKYLKINNFNNCIFNDEIKKLYEEYNRSIDLPKKQKSLVMGSGNGIFYVKNNDVDSIMLQMCKIFDDMLKRNCLNVTILEEYVKDVPQKVLNEFGMKIILNQSLLALACGDSYGAYYERDGLTGVIYDISELPNISINPIITDDTKMATILLKHYIKHKNIFIEKLSEEYRVWAKNDGQKDGIGMHTYAVLIKNEQNKDSQGNGALMRVIPFGIQLIQNGYSFEDAVSLMNRDSAITHKNETIFMANRLALDIAINGIEALDKQIYQNILSKLHLGDTAWVIHTLHIVIETLKMKLSFIDGFKYIVSHGGDTDTNCAIYGAIRGYKEDISGSVNILNFLTMDIVEKLTIKVRV